MFEMIPQARLVEFLDGQGGGQVGWEQVVGWSSQGNVGSGLVTPMRSRRENV